MNCLIYLCLIAMPVLSSAQPIAAIVPGFYSLKEGDERCPESVEPHVLSLGDGRRKVTLTKKINFSFKDLEEKVTWSTVDGCQYESTGTVEFPQRDHDSMIYTYRHSRHCPNTSRNQGYSYVYTFGDTPDQIYYEVIYNPVIDDSDESGDDESEPVLNCVWQR